jgi:hypothetical protein
MDIEEVGQVISVGDGIARLGHQIKFSRKWLNFLWNQRDDPQS